MDPERSGDDKPFRNADASGLDLGGCSWDGEDFGGCDLRGTKLSGCTFNGTDFRDADLWNANLSDADLTEVRNLLPDQLAATKLTRAKLPESISKFEALDSVKGLSENSSKVFITIILAVLYTFLTLATTKDFQLLSDAASSKLPVIGADIPLRYFYYVTPLVLVALFVYFHIYMQRLWEALSNLPAIFPDGKRIDERTPSWLMNDLVRSRLPRLRDDALPLSKLQYWVSITLGYLLVPFTLLAIWATSLRVTDWYLTSIQIAATAIVTAMAARCYDLFCKTLNRSERQESAASKAVPISKSSLVGGFASAIVLFAVSSVALIDMGDVGRFSFAPLFDLLGLHTSLDISGVDISTKPTSWTGLKQNQETELALTRGAHFRRVQLRRISGRGAFFANSHLVEVDLRDCDFSTADMRQSLFELCVAQNGEFERCRFADDLQKSAIAEVVAMYEKSMASGWELRLVRAREQVSLTAENLPKSHSCYFAACNFENARFAQAKLILILADECNFDGCKFTEADCDGALFTSCTFKHADFRLALCRYMRMTRRNKSVKRCDASHATFRSADCRDASFEDCNLEYAGFKDARCDRVRFTGVDLHGADFDLCTLTEADLSEAKGLTEDQLRKAKTIYHAKLPKDLADKLSAEINRPPPPESVNPEASGQ